MSPDQAAGNPLFQLIPYAFIAVIFYFLVFKPQKDSQKKLRDLIDNLQKNDNVITNSGIHGSVAIVKEKTIVLRVDENVRIEFDKEAIASVVKPNA